MRLHWCWGSGIRKVWLGKYSGCQREKTFWQRSGGRRGERRRRRKSARKVNVGRAKSKEDADYLFYLRHTFSGLRHQDGPFPFFPTIEEQTMGAYLDNSYLVIGDSKEDAVNTLWNF